MTGVVVTTAGGGGGGCVLATASVQAWAARRPHPVLRWPCVPLVCRPARPPAGNLVGLLLSPLILQRFGWRALFYMFGAAGLPLLLMWAAVVPNSSGKAGSSSSTSSSSGGGKVGLLTLMSNPATWAIIVANFGGRGSGQEGVGRREWAGWAAWPCIDAMPPLITPPALQCNA